MGTPIHGKDAAIYLQAGGAEAVPIGEQAEYSIELDFDLAETTELGDSWPTFVKGISKWMGSFSGNFDSASSDLWNAATATSARKYYAYPDRGTTTRYYYGTCWVKLPTVLSGGLTDKAKSAVGITGEGALTPKP